MFNQMPEAIENYTPQRIIARQKKQAIILWGVLLFVVLMWISSVIAAPVARLNGYDSIADPIYGFFSHLCHQMSWRSYHIHEEPFAVCVRCFGFYTGFLSGIVFYPFFRSLESTDSFPRFWLFAAMIPMGIDWSLTFFGIWDNTYFSRTLTGLILGFACALFIIPALVEITFLLGRKRRKS